VIKAIFIYLLLQIYKLVMQVSAIDSDVGSNGNVSYSLVKSTDQGVDRFDIDRMTGIITTADVFDREAKIGRELLFVTEVFIVT